MIDTNQIRRSLLRLTQKYTDKRMAKLSDDVMDLCDAYDSNNALQSVFAMERAQTDHTFNLLETLKKVRQ